MNAYVPPPSDEKDKVLEGHERFLLMEELSKRYGDKKGKQGSWYYLRKKYIWLFAVRGTQFLKRFFDIFFSILLLIILSPFIIITALTVKFCDGGPILFITPRVGKFGAEFNFIKFRTMREDANQIKESLQNENERGTRKAFKLTKDPRLTDAGPFLRKYSLDELPQLFSVLKGDMSLVGPRPPLPEEVEHYSLGDRRRLDALPGITGLWQVTARGDGSFQRQVDLDVAYIESQSLWSDLLILLKTIPAVFFGKGAY